MYIPEFRYMFYSLTVRGFTLLQEKNEEEPMELQRKIPRKYVNKQ